MYFFKENQDELQKINFTKENMCKSAFVFKHEKRESVIVNMANKGEYEVFKKKGRGKREERCSVKEIYVMMHLSYFLRYYQIKNKNNYTDDNGKNVDLFPSLKFYKIDNDFSYKKIIVKECKHRLKPLTHFPPC